MIKIGVNRATQDAVEQTTAAPQTVSGMQGNALASGAPAVQISQLRKTFRRSDGTEVPAVDMVDLRVDVGEFVVLLGPSGCGKTTLLRCIAGLETPDAGTIQIGGTSVFSSGRRVAVPPNRRALNMMFQSYALWPHMTVHDNVAFPLRTRRVQRSEIKDRVEEVLRLVGVPELAAHHPAQLSGGQQQRVALARAVVGGDQLILFDEPLSNVDAKVREQLRFELVEMQRRLNFAAIYVTHDQDEALELADRVVVLERGQVAQDAAPAEVYQRPASRYVAKFVGSANELHAIVETMETDRAMVLTALGRVECPITEPVEVGDNVVIIWRPEGGVVLPIDHGGAADGSHQGVIQRVIFAGRQTTLVVQVGDETLTFVSQMGEAPQVGDQVHVLLPVENLVMFKSRDHDREN